MIGHDVEKIFKFFEDSKKNDGYMCPFCGSENVHDWEKSSNYKGASCNELKCPFRDYNWQIIVNKTGKVKDLDIYLDRWEDGLLEKLEKVSKEND